MLKKVGFTVFEAMVVLTIVSILSLTVAKLYDLQVKHTYINATIAALLLDAEFLDHWRQKYGSFIDSDRGKQWPTLPVLTYTKYGKVLYDIELSPNNSPQPDYYHLIAVPSLKSGLKGSGCICVDSFHNVHTGMSRYCNNSNQKC